MHMTCCLSYYCALPILTLAACRHSLIVWLLFVLYGYSTGTLQAQHSPVRQTNWLDTLRVTDRNNPLLVVGLQTRSTDSSLLEHYNGQSLAALLPILYPLQVRTYGNGMLASLSVRGMGPSHSVVNWNGLTLNSPMLGQQDLSLVPGIAYQRLHLQPGSQATVIGADAVAGAVLLQSVPSWQRGLHGYWQAEIGPFGLLTTLLQSRYTLGKRAIWSAQTGGQYQTLTNNFPYRNTAAPGQPIARQTNAAVAQQAFTQSVYGQLNSRLLLALHGWWQQTARFLQPTIGVTNTGEHQRDASLRLTAQLSGVNRRGSDWFLQAGFLQDQLLYTNPVLRLTEPSRSQQVIGRGEWVVPIRYQERTWALRLGADLVLANALTSAYARQQSQYRADAYASLTGTLTSKITLMGQLRQGRASGYAPPLLPALGVTIKLLENQNGTLTGRIHLSRTYRVPTLNDRFWQPGGNATLRPETGWSQEAGITAHRQFTRHLTLTGTLTGFHTRLVDWIQWVPVPNAGYWAPINLLSVNSRGVELDAQLLYTPGTYTATTRLGATYVRVTQTGTTAQLPYSSPLLLTFSQQVRHHRKQVSIQASYTSQQAIRSDQSAFLPGFLLISAQLSYELLANRTLHISLLGANLTNTTYQTLENRAMPSINGHLQLRYTLR